MDVVTLIQLRIPPEVLGRKCKIDEHKFQAVRSPGSAARSRDAQDLVQVPVALRNAGVIEDADEVPKPAELCSSDARSRCHDALLLTTVFRSTMSHEAISSPSSRKGWPSMISSSTPRTLRVRGSSEPPSSATGMWNCERSVGVPSKWN